MFAFLLICCSLLVGDGPQISFQQLEHHFGTVEKGDRVSHVFHFTNSGDADLLIEKVRTSCGCTTATLDKLVYKPGESGSIPVTFDSSEFSGAFAKAVRLTTNEGRRLEWELVIRGDIVQDIDVGPDHLRDDARRGRDKTWEVAVTTRLDHLELLDVSANAPYFSVAWRRVDAQNCIVSVTLLSEAITPDRTRASGDITIRTNAKRQSEIVVRADIEIVEAIKAEPRAIHFFAVKQGARRTRPLLLSSVEGQPFTILGHESSLEFIQLKTEADRLVVLFTGEAEPGPFTGTLTIETDLPAMRYLPIQIRGSVRPPAKAKMNPK